MSIFIPVLHRALIGKPSQANSSSKRRLPRNLHVEQLEHRHLLTVSMDSTGTTCSSTSNPLRIQTLGLYHPPRFST